MNVKQLVYMSATLIIDNDYCSDANIGRWVGKKQKFCKLSDNE